MFRPYVRSHPELARRPDEFEDQDRPANHPVDQQVDQCRGKVGPFERDLDGGSDQPEPDLEHHKDKDRRYQCGEHNGGDAEQLLAGQEVE